ncbi:MAG TPA: hypothetical protein VGF84_09500 [Micromonosporaceae bacterium]|jgi:hypothetical protein
MISKLFDSVFTAKYPRGYTGRHRAEFALAGAGRSSLVRAKSIVSREATA